MNNTRPTLLPFCIMVLFLPFIGKAQTSKLPVPDMPEVFQEGIISTALYERDMAISPDGSEMFYTVLIRPAGFQTIIHRYKTKDGWSVPQVASFSGHYSDLEPAFSADGKKLFFSSNRPLTADQPKDFDIWFMEKRAGGWSAPQNIGSPINTERDEFFPSIAQNGNLYFTATRKNGVGKEDIFVSRWQNGKYAEPVALDSAINTPFYEFNAFVSPDEQFIFFSSFGRAGDMGGGDLYVSTKDANGHWQQAKNCEMLNSEKLDYCPFVSFDKKTLYFTSERHNLSSSFPGKPVTFSQLQHIPGSVLNGNGNIYSISLDSVLQALQGK